MPALMLSTSEKYYPQADKFIPERWLKAGPQYNTKTHPFVTLPFGFGPRMCIGRRFAELEIETLLTKVRWHDQCASVCNIIFYLPAYDTKTSNNTTRIDNILKRRIFRPKKGKLKWGRKRLHKVESHNSYASTNIIRYGWWHAVTSHSHTLFGNPEMKRWFKKT